jgi:Flp pilus assembly protein TadG
MGKMELGEKFRTLLLLPARRLLRRDEGSTAVEFALTGIPLVLLSLGIIEFSRYAYTQSALNYASEEATRYAVVRGGTVTEAELLNVVEDSMLFLDTGLSAVCITAPTGTETAEITVEITYDYQPIFSLVGHNITLVGESDGFIAFSPLNPSSNISPDCTT